MSIACDDDARAENRNSEDRVMTSSNARHNSDDHGSVDSWLVSAGRDRRPGSPLNVPPIPASNFVLGEQRAYSRDDGTAGWEAFEEILGGLEGGSTVAFASGMAGIAAIFDQLSVGSVVALPDDCYQGVAGLAHAGERRGRWTVRRVAVADTARWVELCGMADLIWLESPSNPLLTVGDLDIICAAPRKPGAILGVDNTFATPLNQRLARHANVTLTRHPGLASHPTHEAARRQLNGFGTIISFDVRGDVSAADAVCAGLQLIQHATSLGAVESTMERRASIPGQEHLPPTLLRLSVGIEAVEDLWTDLDRAL
jgi:cystathionine beta-lyase/cystathionine gamma-synthase